MSETTFGEFVKNMNLMLDQSGADFLKLRFDLDGGRRLIFKLVEDGADDEENTEAEDDEQEL